MPRGSAPGERRGGRAKGTPNKKTVAKRAIEAEVIARTGLPDVRSKPDRPLAKEQLQEMLPILKSYVAFFQPTYEGMPFQNKTGKEREFLMYFDLFLSTARALAPYESPTYRALDMRATLPANQGIDPMQVMRAMLDEIDNETRRERAERIKVALPPPTDERKRA